jgi:hypothetical protein
VILSLNYEELQAVRSATQGALGTEAGDTCAIAAPPQAREDLERLLPRLDGEIPLETLEEQKSVERALEVIVECLREEMESAVLVTHPADEGAVAAYFGFAHALSVLHRVREIGEEMEALIEVMTGSPVTPELERSIRFPH